MSLVAAVALGVTGGLVIALYQIDREAKRTRLKRDADVRRALAAVAASTSPGPCPFCDEAATVVDGCCIHCGADRAGEQ